MRASVTRVWASWLVTALTAVLPALSVSLGQEPDAAKPDTGKAQLEEMGRVVRLITLARNEAGARRPVELKGAPLHRWNDPTRGFSDGALWAWGGPGRPTALTAVELYQTPPSEGFWSIELVSLAAAPLDAEGHDETTGRAPVFRWNPATPGLEIKLVPGAPKPAPDEPARLRQARQIATRFTAEEVNRRTGNQRYVLRLLPRPIHRYADPAESLLDGAIFLFANGTNPEVVLVLEARDAGPLAGWSYAAARLSRAAPEVFLDGRMVWSQPYVQQAASNDPYYFVAVSRLRQN